MKPSTLTTIGIIGIILGIISGIAVCAFVSVAVGIGCIIAGILIFIEMQYKASVIAEEKKQSVLLYEIYDIIQYRFGDNVSKNFSEIYKND